MRTASSPERRSAWLTVIGVLALLLSILTASPASAAPPAGTITGHVRLGTAAQPAGAGDVIVTLEKYDGSTASPLTGVSAVTDAAGVYTFTGLTAARYNVIFTYVGTGPYLAVNAPYTAFFDGTEFDYTVPYAYTVAGRVSLDTAGSYAGAGAVRVTANVGFTTVTAVTDADGRYSLGRLQNIGGGYALKFEYLGSENYPTWYYTGDSRGASQTTYRIVVSADRTDYDVVVGAGVSFSGRLTDSAGEPISGHELRVLGVPPGYSYPTTVTTVVTNTSGDYHLRGLPNGWSYYVTWGQSAEDGYSAGSAPDGNLWTFGSIFTPTPDQWFSGIDATLYEDSSITVDVDWPASLDSAMDGPGAAQVQVEWFDESSGVWTEPSTIGQLSSVTHSARLDGVPPGQYRVTVDYLFAPRPFPAVTTPPFEVDEGEDVEVSVEIEPVTGAPAGTLVKFSNSPNVYVADGIGGLILLPSFDVARDFGIPHAVITVDPATFPVTSTYGPLQNVVDCRGSQWLAANGRISRVTSTPLAGWHRTTVPSALCDALPHGPVLDGPLFVRADHLPGFPGLTDDRVYWVGSDSLRAFVPDGNMLRLIANGQPINVAVVTSAYLTAEPIGDGAYAPAALVKSNYPPATTVYFMNGAQRIPLATFGPAIDAGISPTFSAYPGSMYSLGVPGTSTSSTPLSNVMSCGGVTLVAGSSALWPVEPSLVAGIPTTVLTDATCARMNRKDVAQLDALLVKSASSPTIYSVSGATKHALLTMASVTRLGGANPTILTVNDAFLTSLTTGAAVLEPGMLVKGTTPNVYLVDTTSPLRLVPLTSFGPAIDAGIGTAVVTVPNATISGATIASTPLSNVVSCLSQSWVAGSGKLHQVDAGSVSGLTPTTLADATCQALPRSTATAGHALFVKGSAATIYRIVAGAKQPVLTFATLVNAYSPAAPIFLTVNDAFLASLTTGGAVIEAGMLIKGTAPDVYLVDGTGGSQKLIRLASFGPAIDAGLGTAFATVANATISSATIASGSLTNVVTCLGATWIAGSGKLSQVDAAQVTGASSTALADATCQALPRSTALVGRGLFVKGSAPTIYQVTGGVKSPVLSMVTLTNSFGSATPVFLTVSDAFLAGLATGTPVIEPGMLVKGAAVTVYLVDGSGSKFRLTTFATIADMGLPTTVYTVANTVIDGFVTAANPLTNLLSCGGDTYLAGSGRLWKTSSSAPGSLPVSVLSAQLCASAPPGTNALEENAVVKAASSPTVWWITAGQKRPIGSWPRVLELTRNTGTFAVVDAGFLASLPTGAPTP